MMQRAVAGRIPLSGSFALTHRCNLRCVHCYLGAERSNTRPRSNESRTAFWCDLIDQIADAGCLDLLLTGGEPLIRRDFIEIYSKAVRRGLLTTVFTNATLINDRVLEAFVELPPRLVEITLYGATEQVYEAVTGVPGSYRRYLEGLDALTAAGVHIGLKSMIMAENRHEIPLMRAIAHERGAEFRVDPALFPRRDGDPSPLTHRVEAEEAIALEMADERFRTKAAGYLERMRNTPVENRLFSCLAGRTGFHVDPRGTLLPCLMVTTNGFDLHTGSFLAGWRGPIEHFTELKVAADNECATCENRFICGLCPAQFELETGTPHRKTEYACQLGAARCKILKKEVATCANTD
jgi:radical SAM protein with 4Fe4S-binding SPASM domain